MRNQVIECVSFNPVSEMVLHPDAYSYQPGMGLAWLQRACIAILRKIGCHYSRVETVRVERHVIDADLFVERLISSLDTVDHYFGYKPKKLLIGAEDFRELMGDELASQCVSFDARYGYDKEMFGMKVTIVPWMRGFLIVPPNDRQVR